MLRVFLVTKASYDLLLSFFRVFLMDAIEAVNIMQAPVHMDLIQDLRHDQDTDYNDQNFNNIHRSNPPGLLFIPLQNIYVREQRSG